MAPMDLLAENMANTWYTCKCILQSVTPIKKTGNEEDAMVS